MITLGQPIAPTLNMRGRSTGPARGPSGLTPDQDLANRRAGLDSKFTQAYQQNQGLSMPFTDDVKKGLFAQAADMSAGQVRGNTDLIKRQFAMSGLANSGGELAAIMAERRRAQKGLAQSKNQINTTAIMENQAASERALDRLLRAISSETQYQSQMENTQEDQLSQALLKLGQSDPEGYGNMGAGGLAGAGGGGSMAGLLGGGDDWYAQWEKDQAQSNADAAARYSAYRSTPGRTPAGKGQVQGAPANPFGGGILGMMWGSGGAEDQGPPASMAYGENRGFASKQPPSDYMPGFGQNDAAQALAFARGLSGKPGGATSAGNRVSVANRASVNNMAALASLKKIRGW